VWADQVTRFRRLEAALALASRVAATVEQASLVEWLGARLQEDAGENTTLVYHSIVEEYLPAPQLAAFYALMEEAGARATPRAPLAWVRLEPQPRERRHVLTFQCWPGGPRRPLALCGAHGTNVRAFVR
jgi:hypothetical protein